MKGTITIQCPDCGEDIERTVEADPGEEMVWGATMADSYPGTGSSVDCTDELPDECPHCMLAFSAADKDDLGAQSERACENFDFSDGGYSGPDTLDEDDR